MVHVDIIRYGFSINVIQHLFKSQFTPFLDCDPELGKITGIRSQALSSDQLRGKEQETVGSKRWRSE